MVDLAAVYSRELDGKRLTIAPSGWTYKRTFVLYDQETGTLWYPDKDGLLGIQGKYFQRHLPRLESTDTRWSTWVKSNPSTRLMK
ncbi:DUF3179 domain-containing (seleno)protein [Desulfosarcina sp.]|uniref:DUF3179 domain-containing (seleno)protein n=1 Tax=Desulfosarcina sp. TaxID=2027861 RepID=UPI0035669CE8